MPLLTRPQPPHQAFSLPLADLHVADPELFRADAHWSYFERLRREDPVHYHREGLHQDGAYWSISRYDDIVAVETDPATFSSEPVITIHDHSDDFSVPMFIAMDPPQHEAQRKAVTPAFSAPNLRALEPLIRSRIQDTLDSLPIGEPFDWVDKVSVELTTQMLATLFDFPWDERRKLTRWSDIATAGPESGLFSSTDPKIVEQERSLELFQCAEYFTRLWTERSNAPPAADLISMLAHSEATRSMSHMEFLGNLILLIVGGNDTTRNAMTGSVLALHENPGERRKLDSNPALIPSMVSETLRWQTPLAHMRRTATRDVEFGGKTIRKGEKVILWYVSGNRDEAVIEQPNAFIVDRERPRQHLAFGFGIHRCVGNRLAELQLKILWEEILARFPTIEVLGEPCRLPSVFVRGYSALHVQIPTRL